MRTRYDLAFSRPVLLKESFNVAVALRGAAMSHFGRLSGGGLSPILSGRNQDGSYVRGWEYAHYMPLDADGDGLIDAADVYIPDSVDFSQAEKDAVLAIRKVEMGNGLHADAEIHHEDLSFVKAKTFTTHTPVVPVRFIKPWREKDKIEAQVAVELARRGLPEAKVQFERWIGHYEGRPEWPKFHAVLTLHFAEPIPRLIALGRGSHFGLGTFVPVR